MWHAKTIGIRKRRQVEKTCPFSLSLYPFPQPHAEETVVDNIATIILIDVLAFREAFQCCLNTAEGGQAVFADEGLGHRRFDTPFFGNG